MDIDVVRAALIAPVSAAIIPSHHIAAVIAASP